VTRMPRRMARPRTPVTVACALLAALALAACGERGDEREPVREGIALELGGIEYNIFITRQLNPRDVTDRSYVEGKAPPPRNSFYGVFLQACNRSKDEVRPTARGFRIATTQDEEFEPVPPDHFAKDNAFIYRAQRLAPQTCIPPQGGVAELGPTAGAMLLFQLPLAATENRPLELEIFDGTGAAKEVELDI
jgi:hypothetical protein